MPPARRSALTVAGGPVRVVFMGTPRSAVPVLEGLLASPGLMPVAVYTTPDRPRGRGRSVEMPPVKTFAQERGLPVHQPESLRAGVVREELAQLRPDVVVVAAYGKLLPPAVLRIPPRGCLNLHPSLLPRYRGPSPVASAILQGETATGVSLMLLDEGMDTGPVIAQRELVLTGRETADSLTSDLFVLGAEVLLECLGPWVEENLTAAPQDEARATTTRKLQRGDGEADWNLSAAALDRRCRAYFPWPGLFTQWEGKTLKLLDVVPLPLPEDLRGAGPQAGGVGASNGPYETGLVVSSGPPETPVAVITGDGLLGLRSLQLADRRAQSAPEFVRGRPDFVGARL